MKIAIGSDHGGIHLKNHLKDYLQGKGWEILDCGTYTEASCDYPDIAAKLCGEIAKGTVAQGILVCGTGLGMSIAANKCAGIRAAVVTDEYSAVKSKEHNNANVLCLGERVLGTGLAESLVDAWLKTEFAGGRHARRVDKIMDLGK
jgi:ribose 5-phosphate isomerase B